MMETMAAEEQEEESTSGVPALGKKADRMYRSAYESFCYWKKQKSLTTSSELVLVQYLTEMAQRYKPSSLWLQYSMLKYTLKKYEDVHINKYSNMLGFLKQQNKGFQPRRASIFSLDNLETFLRTAPDDSHLATKVALILGVFGACRAIELYNLRLSNLQNMETAMIVTIPDSSIKGRKCTITHHYYEICKKYTANRTGFTDEFLFHQYKDGKIRNPRLRVKHFVIMGRDIAKFLKLPHPENYSGHSMRRSSASIIRNIECGGVPTWMKPTTSASSDEPNEIFIKAELGSEMEGGGRNVIDESSDPDYNPESEEGYSDDSREADKRRDVPSRNAANTMEGGYGNSSINNRTADLVNTLNIDGATSKSFHYEKLQSTRINPGVSISNEVLHFMFHNCTNVTINVINE